MVVSPTGSTTVRGRRLVWIDAEGVDRVCQVVSIQKPTTNPAVLESLGMCVFTKTGRPAGQEVCDLLTNEAAKVLNRLGLA